MIIPGRAQCDCFSDKKIHIAKTGKLNRDEYRIDILGQILQKFHFLCNKQSF